MNSNHKEALKNKVQKIKLESGTHSPALDTLQKRIPELKVNIDACFLSNPYATNLFLSRLDTDLIKTNEICRVLEFYPPQNQVIAATLSGLFGVDARNIFVGNGAVEIIQAILHNFVKKKLVVIIPTFSSYYEFVNTQTEVLYYELKKEDNFNFNVDDFLSFIKKQCPDSVVIINPNNPNGSYLNTQELKIILDNLKGLDNIILDESFVHFAYQNEELGMVTIQDWVSNYKNLVLIKSMSKDFGIAGIRAGYALMNREKVNALLKRGYLWNVSGLSNYFFNLYVSDEFQKKYEIVRKKYILIARAFMLELSQIDGIKCYPSKANFILVEILNGLTSFDFTMELLIRYGIYVRDCSDKIGLEGEFVRIASRTFEENIEIIDAIKQICQK